MELPSPRLGSRGYIGNRFCSMGAEENGEEQTWLMSRIGWA